MAISLKQFDEGEGSHAQSRQKQAHCYELRLTQFLNQSANGTALDQCPDDPDKTQSGVCGCGQADTDSDGDGSLNCNDGCPNDPGKMAPGVCGCGTPDTDSDGDGVVDSQDQCPDTPAGATPAPRGNEGSGCGR